MDLRRHHDARWFTWESGGHRVALTPWAQDVLAHNVIPAAYRDDFVREFRFFLSKRRVDWLQVPSASKRETPVSQWDWPTS